MKSGLLLVARVFLHSSIDTLCENDTKRRGEVEIGEERRERVRMRGNRRGEYRGEERLFLKVNGTDSAELT